jgi:hypothetical protein
MECSIEILLNLNTLSMEKLISRFKAAEKCHQVDRIEANHIGKLLLSEEEWLTWMNHRDGGASASQARREGDKARGCRKGNPSGRCPRNRDTSKAMGAFGSLHPP